LRLIRHRGWGDENAEIFAIVLACPLLTQHAKDSQAPGAQETAMAGVRVDIAGAAWETWDDHTFAAKTKVRWKLIFSGDQTPTESMSMGLAEIAPGGALPMHHHEPAEIYHVLDGNGLVEIGGVSHRLQPGISVFVPPDAWHQTTNTGSTTLRFLFVFPTRTFGEVLYHFSK
jgi:quercetin dioxygenase-like cupin family protein